MSENDEISALRLKEWFDFSDYPKDHPPYDESNKVIRRFRDELNGNIMIEIVVLKPKPYVYQIEDGKESERSKGVKKNIIKTLKLDDYRECLLESKIIRK